MRNMQGFTKGGRKAVQGGHVARTRVWRVGRAAEFWEGMGEVWVEGYLLRGIFAQMAARW